MQAVSSSDIPHFNSGISIAWHQYIGVQLHAGGQWLVARQGVLQLTRFHVPDTDWRVQWPAYYVDAVKLKIGHHIGVLILLPLLNMYTHRLSLWILK